MSKIYLLLAALLLAFNSAAYAGTLVQLDTSVGPIVVELEDDKAPKSVANFLRYVEEGFYTDTIFHRVIKGFVIQGGGFTTDFTKKGGLHAKVMNEADNGLSNVKGTLAMARTRDPHSATSQFYINVGDNSSTLDHRAKNPRDWGYTVFGKVVSGWENVEKIERTKTANQKGMRDTPMRDIVIHKASVISAE